ncbi:hypothetical protein SAMN05518871_10749 [Psychrobacillus sp. OK028]|uniref:hypothetical protein n=1 Tax=Psychrobacillus sp. OK028 TaxID=1884359 RepID=UPI0008826E7D|nr:hypothetical protein [Psychrobacillus sp. OK028]SDN71838.1 hypothetical protein SAMN05518871_10749 [Psychrobacillus sp. OK028]
MKRVFAITLLGLSLLLPACSSELSKQGRENEFPPTMTATIEVNGQSYEMMKGNYSWERKQGMETQVIQADTASPYQIAENYDAIEIDQSKTIHIKIEDEPTLTAYLWDANSRQQEVPVNDNQIEVPKSAGKYVYEVLAQWANGEVSYTFVIDKK